MKKNYELGVRNYELQIEPKYNVLAFVEFSNFQIFKFILILFFILNSEFCISQDIHFSQFAQSPLTNNPASAGMIYGSSFRVIANQKLQWSTIGAKYTTSAVSFDMPVFKKPKRGSHLGMGLYAYTDKAGDSKFGKTQLSLCVSGIVPLSTKSRLSAGIEASGAQVSADLSSLQWGNQFNGLTYDPSLLSNEAGFINSGIFFDMATGIYYEYRTKMGKTGDQKIEFNGGIAYYHILRPDQALLSSIDKLYSKVVLQSYFRYDLPESRLSLVPSTVIFLQGPYKEINFGSLFRWRLNTSSKYTVFFDENALLFGCYYRYKDAIIPQFILEIGNWGIGFSYDVNVSSLRSVSGYKGGVEISLKYLHMNSRTLGK